jgi:hypothetical protein
MSLCGRVSNELLHEKRPGSKSKAIFKKAGAWNFVFSNCLMHEIRAHGTTS